MSVPVTPEVLSAKLDGLHDMLAERDRRMDERARGIDKRFAELASRAELLADQLEEYKELASQWRVPGSAVFLVFAGLVTSLILHVVNLFWKVSP